MSEDVTLSDDLLLKILDEARGNGGGTDDMPCACGRFNFNRDYRPEDEEACDFEELREAAERFPEEFCEHEEGSIHWVSIGGKDVVLGCPCGKDLELAKMIWGSRAIIAEFLLICSNELRREAAVTGKAAKMAKEAVRKK